MLGPSLKQLISEYWDKNSYHQVIPHSYVVFIISYLVEYNFEWNIIDLRPDF